jgi:hypothetical protein
MILTGGPLGGINLRGAIAPTLDPETVTYFAAMDAANEPYWPSEKLLIDGLIKSLKIAALWNKIILLWMPVGALLSGAMRAIKHPLGVGTALTNTGFSEGDWGRTVGLDGRFSSFARLDTRITEFDLISNNTHVMLISEAFNSAGSGSNRDIGVKDKNRTLYCINLNTNTGLHVSFSSQGSEYSGSPGSPIGVYIADRSNSKTRIIKNGQSLINTAQVGSVIAPESGNIMLFGVYSGSQSAHKIFSGMSMGLSMTDTEAQAYNTILQAVRTARAALTPP